MIQFFNRLPSLTKFCWILLFSNALFIGFYFSGVAVLQQLIAPTINKANFSFQQMREFGLLEMTQNVLLLSIIIILLKGAIRASLPMMKAFFSVGVAAFIFLFLEELDYGLHIYKYFTGEFSDTQYMSWHNQWNDGVENATKLKRANDVVNGLWFFVIPLLFKWAKNEKITNNFFYKLIPTVWFPLGFLIAFACSKGAHQLDELGLAVINGINGNLQGTIAEFRETSIYYLYFLYAIHLLTNLTEPKKS